MIKLGRSSKQFLKSSQKPLQGVNFVGITFASRDQRTEKSIPYMFTNQTIVCNYPVFGGL